MSYYDDYEVMLEEYPDRRHIIKKSLPPDEHYMNKNEGKALRRLKSKTGSSEKELRSMKKYRKVLSDAQDIEEKPTSDEHKRAKYLKNLRKNVAQELNVPVWHPSVKPALREKIEELKRWGRFPYYMRW